MRRHTGDLARLQHASAAKLADVLPDSTELYPTHGFGSFCASTQSDATSSTIGNEQQSNPVLTQDEDTYVRELLEGLSAFPAYYAHMPDLNAAGPSAPDLSPPQVAEPDALRNGSSPGNGSSTCATAPRSPPATPTARSTSASTGPSPPTWAGSSTGAPRSPCSARPPTT